MTHVPGMVPLTVEEYLRLEEQADVRHEYVAGAVYAMSGATLRHNLLLLNIARCLHAPAAAAGCNVFVNDVKVRTADDAFYYPDVVVACGVLDDQAVYLREPCLIVEVTSKSTRRTDRHEKLQAYCAMPSVRAYLIVDQRRRWVEAHVRGTDGVWVRTELSGDDTLALPCPATTLALREVYEGVSLPVVSEPEPWDYDA